jgi:hypothetical protein
MLMLSCLAAGCSSGPQSFPRTVREVPQAFRSGWDEYVPCEQREPRFSITRNRLYNFDVEWVVREVVLHSPSEIDLVTVLRDPDDGMKAEEAVWSLRLIDGGRKLTGRSREAPVYSRCRDTTGR